MKSAHDSLLKEYEQKTRKGYPLGEVKQDLLEKGYSELKANEFMILLSSRINEKVAHKEKNLMATAAIILFACGLVLFFMGLQKGILFMVAGAIWWTVDFIANKSNLTPRP